MIHAQVLRPWSKGLLVLDREAAVAVEAWELLQRVFLSVSLAHANNVLVI